MIRVGLFGGSFDPVHRGHLALARSALDALALDELRWIPVGHAWQKSRRLTPAVHREAMLRLAVDGEPRFSIERCELERSGPSYTIDTVRALQARDGSEVREWLLLIGQDQYAGLHTWVGWQELVSRVTLAVANRPGTAPRPDRDVLRMPYQVVPLPMMDVSSSTIRDRIARGLPVSDLVPPRVASYIETHALYRADSGS